MSSVTLPIKSGGGHDDEGGVFHVKHPLFADAEIGEHNI